MKDVKCKARELYEKYNSSGWVMFEDRYEKLHCNLSPKQFVLKELNELIILDTLYSKFWREVKQEIINFY